MPLPRFDNLDAAQRARILACARSEFARQGYEQASLARIASEAGISKGTLYYYFADRDDVYASVVMDLVQSFGETFLLKGFAPKQAAEYWPTLQRLFHTGLELARQYPEEMRALRSFQTSLRRHPRPAFKPVLALITTHMRVLVETGRKLKCVRTDLSVDLLVALLQAVDEVLDQALFDDTESADSARLHAYAELAFDTFRRLLEPGPTSAPRRTQGRLSAKTKTKTKTAPNRKRGEP
jgi:AcrR family transcriptional regulator